jgi:hypothetical protein
LTITPDIEGADGVADGVAGALEDPPPQATSGASAAHTRKDRALTRALLIARQEEAIEGAELT